MPTDRDGENFVTDNNTGGYFVFECDCGAIGNSSTLAVQYGQDDSACFCPKCGDPDPDECENSAAVWNHQQKKINELRMTMGLVVQDIEMKTRKGDLSSDDCERWRKCLIDSFNKNQ